MASARPSDYLVVVGSSAGGIDALSALVALLPTTFPAPIVIAQHLEPSRQSHLREILARRSTLPVRTITDRAPLESGVVYVVPSNQHVRISDHEIALSEAADGGPKPSVDLLFSSAAEVYGDRLIAVILSGTGSDGALGAQMAKRQGGIVIIQDPDTAAYPGMPQSLPPTSVDIVANIERIGPILGDLVNGVGMPAAKSEEKQTLESFLVDVRQRTGLDFNTYKTPTIVRRLQRRVIATDTGDLQGYAEYLRRHPEEYQNLVNTFLIKVTEFFRDHELFNYLRETILLDLIAQSRRRGNELRIWSAGTSTGEEAYSLAILVSEVLGSALEHFNVRIFATDADAGAISFARRGVYPASALANMPAELVSRYFDHESGSYQVKKRIRTLTVFGQHDLGGRAPFPNMDMVVCRNVLIYFTPELQQRTLTLFAYSLRNGGYLVLGKAETPSQLSEFFNPVDKTQKVYRREGERLILPTATTTESRTSLVPRPPVGPRMPVQVPGLRTPQRTRTPADVLLTQLPVGVVVVERRYDIQSLNAAARRFLSIHGAAIGEDLVHSARGPSTQRLRQLIDSVRKSGTPATIQEYQTEVLATGETLYLQVACFPYADGDENASTRLILIIHDVTPFVQSRQTLEESLQTSVAEATREKTVAESEKSQAEQITHRLIETNRQLMEANQELTSANEELRATNEEFLLNAEEAQAAVEEVETLNEELQATNEELETLNEELQATIEELNTTNDDLHSRSIELQDLARASERERAQLSAILVSMSDAVLVVSDTGESTLTNAAYDALLKDADAPFIPRDDAGEVLPDAATPQQRVARGEQFTMEFTTQRNDGTRRWYEAVGHPIVYDNERRGGVVAIRDITERSMRRLQDEFLALASHELRTPLTPLRVYLQMLQKANADQPADSTQLRHIRGALKQADRLNRLVNDLVDVRRLQSGKFSLSLDTVHLNPLVAQTIEVGQTLAEGQAIHFDNTKQPLYARADAGRIEQVLLNLLTNAIAHAPSSPTIDVSLSRERNRAVIRVSDHGPGIPESELPKLFSRFYQAQSQPGKQPPQRGLGLGLYIAHEIIQAHDGTIEVASTVGQGTTFTISLPLTEPSQTRKS